MWAGQLCPVLHGSSEPGGSPSGGALPLAVSRRIWRPDGRAPLWNHDCGRCVSGKTPEVSPAMPAAATRGCAGSCRSARSPARVDPLLVRFQMSVSLVSHDFAINFNPEDDECEGSSSTAPPTWHPSPPR
ncbi:copine-7 isoform X2 [Rhinolophus sinicus]|uniref:copine-7 isoform X2 n=1 Tax=Rhinolophus sinicus TaxID=89399 RepID=UPI003D7B9915